MLKLDAIKINGVASAATQSKCRRCTNSKCCTYITQPIDTPRKKTDFEYLLWLVSHEQVKVYKDTSEWFLLVETPCTHLQPNGDCGIYEYRPEICRNHSNDYCEFDAPAEEGFRYYFPDYPSLLAYCKQRFKKWTLG